MSKIPFVKKFLPILGSVVSLIVVTGLQAQDFESSASLLSESTGNLELLENKHGRYGFLLVEPLQQIARQQLNVNQYNAAAQTVERAIQIARVSQGLYTPYQYDLVELEVEVDLRRQDFESVSKRLDYYAVLIGDKYQGDPTDRMERLLWLADTHLRAAVDGDREKLAIHLAAATRINEAAIAYAAASGLAESERFAEAVYGLIYKYYLQTRGILAGGSTGLNLREAGSTGLQVDLRGTAIERRFQDGLTQLENLRELFRHSTRFSHESVGMAELYIADWHLLFDKTEDIAGQYDSSRQQLAAAGIPADRLERFFARPVALPRPRLAFSLSEAMTTAPVTDEQTASANPLHRLQLLEPTAELPGFAQDLDLLDWSGGHRADWSRLTVSMKVDPQTRTAVWNRGYRSESLALGSDFQVLDKGKLSDGDVRDVMRRVETLTYRPALKEGQPVATYIALDYLFHASAQPSLSPVLADLTTPDYSRASAWAANPGASLAAAGE